MATSYILNVPIQLNRGSSNTPSLSDGEPYFNTNTQTLFIQGAKGIQVNITGDSASTGKLVSNQNSNFISLNRDSSTLNLGGLYFSYRGSSEYSAMPVLDTINFTLGSIKLSDVRTTTLRQEEMYGTSFPSNPIKGQLFFKFA